MILVTGGLGYIGSHCVKQLKKQGEDVIILDNLEFGHLSAGCGCKTIIGDVKDTDITRKIFKENDIEAVLHFAAYTSVGESVQNPQRYYKQNVAKTIALMEVMNEFDCKKMIFSSTAATFGEPEYVPIDEKHPQNPKNPYGATKLMVERIMKDYEVAYGIHSVALRYFNASGADPEGEIGEDHRPETHIIPIIIQQALGQREKVYVFGDDYDTPDGTCIRDYVHVNDLAKAHLLALKALRGGQKTSFYNMGNGNGFSVLEIIKAVEKVSGVKIKYEIGPRRAGDPAKLIATSSKIEKELEYKADFPSVEKIIETAWNWHKNHPNGYND